jgi:hypothetical protein
MCIEPVDRQNTYDDDEYTDVSILLYFLDKMILKR